MSTDHHRRSEDALRTALRGAREIELRPGTSLELSRPGNAWLVRSGTVDFAAELTPEPGAAAWRDVLFSVGEGGVLLGFPAADTLRLAATGRGDTTLIELDGKLQEQISAAGSPTAAALFAAVEAWLTNLSSTLGRLAPAIDFVDEVLRPGAAARLRSGERLASARGLLWVQIVEGCFCFLDGAALPADDALLLPLVPTTWLTADADSAVRGVGGPVGASTGAGSLPATLWRASAERFQGLAGELLESFLAAVWQDEQRRLATKSSLLARDRQAVLRRFSAVIDRRGEGDTDNDPPLVAACRRIGDALGVEVRAGGDAESWGSVAAWIEDISRRSRLRSRPVLLRDRWWLQETRPMLAFRRDDGAPLVLLPGKGRRTLWEPGAGGGDGAEPRTEAVTEQAARQILPTAYSFFRTLPDRPLGIRDLIRFSTALCRRDLAAALLFGTLVMLMGMLVPIAIGLIVDVSIPAHQPRQLIFIAAGLVVAAVAAFCFKICQDIAILRVEGKVAEALPPSLLDRLLRMPNTFFRRHSAGDLAERLQHLEHVQSALSGGALSTLLAGVLSLLSFAILFALQPAAALVAGALIAFLLLVLAATGRRQRGFWSTIQRIEGLLSSMVLQMISGIHRIRLAGAEDRMFVRWGHLSMEFRDALSDCYNSEVRFNAWLRGYQVFAFAAVFGTLAWFDDGSLTTGRFLAFLAAFTLTLTGFARMSQAVLPMIELLPMVDRLQPLLANVPESEEQRAHPGELSGRLEVKELVFRYGKGMPRVLEGLSLEIEPGQSVAIVGASGCGKSTLFRLILGFEQPTAGSIYFDGKDLAALDLREVRHQIGVVLQHDELMEASIYANIRGDNDISVDAAWQAARMCGIAEDIEAMPLGMHTVISATGSDLSGGQIQRLLIARALAARPRILLLDEATSALDNRAQAVVTESLDRLRVTRIAIAHRLSTVRTADRIFVVDRGRVAESGDYEELMAAGGVFARLVRRQLK